MEKRCLVCGAELRGRQLKFCSRHCKNSATNNRHQNYEARQLRGRRRRELLIRRKGGRCERCSYGRNGAAVTFHHVDPSAKSFPLDIATPRFIILTFPLRPFKELSPLL
jgi:hypothetical protein